MLSCRPKYGLEHWIVSHKKLSFVVRKSKSKIVFWQQLRLLLKISCMNALLQKFQIYMVIRYHWDELIYQIWGLCHVLIWRCKQAQYVKKWLLPPLVISIKYKRLDRWRWISFYTWNLVKYWCKRDFSSDDRFLLKYIGFKIVSHALKALQYSS